ncbi:MAG: peptide-methionine (S)-S-oxide reductase [Gammaproteobacteria bacterium]|nr:MAG: peptide-methionine (S)-S-oxide reductase [Gammaproteobacteria bacterium]
MRSLIRPGIALFLPILMLFTITTNASPVNKELKTATFAGGCFWCMEPPYDKLDGVISTTSGYAGGHVKNPTYKQVSSGGTGHTEVVQVVYDPNKVNYKQLLDVFWKNIDPLTANAQFCDRGSQYRSAIFYHDDAQKALAEASINNIKTKFKQPVVTEINKLATFYPAEDYHQDYYQKNPVRYKYYRWSCRRDNRLEELWGKSAIH